MTEREALKLALEALEKSHTCPLLPDDCAEAITAIKEALMSVPDGAQPEQEPVAWRAWVSKFPQGTGSDWVYVTKPIMEDRIHNQPLYTTPPQRKPLTDKEIKAVCAETWSYDPYVIARAIEAAHGIKGEA